ncbi:acyltransferase family protein [Shimia sp. SDUM112013]|uniref:acyltransferase family protein n=1 Tax=Shimia sp. SDUM112013 TaxID=3136160 RepID=UPI0032EF69D2
MPKPAAPLAHRAEIDGLRSIAVMAVVLYHFDVAGVGGGFVGVDIFFVISGFLIGSILWRELEIEGQISLSRFYLRRIRRLAPAYFVMVFAALLVGWFALLPFDFRELGKGAIAATVYLSNVLFYRQAGYFDGSAEEKLLLHTWSLSVEEQFYLFLPLALLLFARWKHTILPALWGLFATSLIASLYLTYTHQPAAFYLFPFRAWELLAGVLLSIVGHQQKLSWKLSSWVSWAGLGLVVGSILLSRPDYGFPGWQAIVPVLGTVLLILGGQGNNPVNRALSTKAPVFIGLISYSLYLWHWPVMVFATYIWGPPDSLPAKVFWIAVSMGLAALCWRFVEQPVRRSANISPRTVFSVAAGTSALVLLLGAVVFKADGLPDRFSPETRIHIDASADFIQDWSRCHIPATGRFQGIEVCPIGPDGPQHLLIWGDSHLRAYMDGLAQLADEQQTPALILWRAGCPPFFGASKTERAATAAQDQECETANRRIESDISEWSNLAAVLLVGRWAYYATGQGYGIDAHNTIEVSPGFSALASRTVETLNDTRVNVFVAQQVPELANYDSRRVARDLAYGRLSPEQAAEAARISKDAVMLRQASVRAVWDTLSAQGAIQRIDTWPNMCDGANCFAIHGQVGQYFDNNHLTNAAAQRLRALFLPAFEAARKGETHD